MFARPLKAVRLKARVGEEEKEESLEQTRLMGSLGELHVEATRKVWGRGDVAVQAGYIIARDGHLVFFYC